MVQKCNDIDTFPQEQSVSSTLGNAWYIDYIEAIGFSKWNLEVTNGYFAFRAARKHSNDLIYYVSFTSNIVDKSFFSGFIYIVIKYQSHTCIIRAYFK